MFNAQLGLVTLFGPAQFPPRFPAQDLDQSAHVVDCKDVNYNVFDMELRKRKQPDSDSDNQ